MAQYEWVVRINGTDAAFSPIGRSRSRKPKICTSVSLFVFKDRKRVFHALLDVGPGVCEAIQQEDQFPRAFPLDWVILSHSHSDHFSGLDTLCGDYHWWGLSHTGKGAKIPLYCLPSTYEQTVGTFVPFQKKHIEHTTAEVGKPFTLWKDGRAQLQITMVEVIHFKQSVSSIFTFQNGTEEARAACLFDFSDFYPEDSPQAKAGSHSDNPLFQQPDLLIAEATMWTDQRETVGWPGLHICFQKLADYLCQWQPHQARIVHYAGFEDMYSEDPEAYWKAVKQGKRIHPSLGPTSEWELNCAIQQHLNEKGYAVPERVRVGLQGEAIRVYPPLR